MRKKVIFGILYVLLIQTHFGQEKTVRPKNADFSLVFGSCSKQNVVQPFWKEIQKHNPDLFIWGGDIIYADSSDPMKIKEGYKMQNNNIAYKKVKQSIPIMATWDDHDYGKNDAGAEWELKKQSQQLFLDFLEMPEDSPRRVQKGIYHSQLFEIDKGNIKVITLDTRYFRSPLKKSSTKDRRYVPYDNQEGTLLGEEQWQWLEKELENNFSDFIIIVSSIQFLSAEHGFETWGNFPP